jgi:hypothetical protein
LTWTGNCITLPLMPNFTFTMKKICLFIVFACLASIVKAHSLNTDTTYWKSKYESALGFSQTVLSNWAKGGEKSSYSANIILNVYKDYSRKSITWNNYLGIAYGLSKQQSITMLRKTDDKINFLTKGGIYAWKNWDYTGFFEFKSQFSEGFLYPNDSVHISAFMAPAYFQLSLGMNYKPVEYFAVFISPGGARLTVVNDSTLTNRKEGAYGVYGDNTTLWQVGGSINAIFKKDIMKNVNLLSKLDIFSNYRDRPNKLIVGWENNILMKVNKYISLNISTMLIYDEKAIVTENNPKFKDILQFRETFGVGLAYTIFH